MKTKKICPTDKDIWFLAQKLCFFGNFVQCTLERKIIYDREDLIKTTTLAYTEYMMVYELKIYLKSTKNAFTIQDEIGSYLQHVSNVAFLKSIMIPGKRKGSYKRYCSF